jgi:hypothetical protein
MTSNVLILLSDLVGAENSKYQLSATDRFWNFPTFDPPTSTQEGLPPVGKRTVEEREQEDTDGRTAESFLCLDSAAGTPCLRQRP